MTSNLKSHIDSKQRNGSILFYTRLSRKMSDKTKNFTAPAPKTLKTKRPSTVSVATASSRTKSSAITKEKVAQRPTSKNIKNTTDIGDGDLTILKQEGSMPDFDPEYRQIAYGKFLRAMLEECLVDDKIQREETEMDLQMAQLADRFQRTMDQLDKTNRRLKDISFVVEQKRLLDLKNTDSSQFFQMTDDSNTSNLLQDLNATEKSCLDKLETKNVDFGFDKDSGHKQLLDAVNDAIEGLDQIKKHSNLDADKFKEYEKSQQNIGELEKEKFNLETLKADFEAKFPKFNEKLLKEASEKIAKMIENEDDED